jgi:hypothetical protein
VARRLLRPDAYGWLLLLILGALVLTAFGGRIGAGGIVLQAGCLVYGQWISQLPRRWWWPVWILAAAAVVVGIVSAVTDRPGARIVAATASVLLAVATIGVILRRIVQHPTISGATVGGAVSAYLLAGLAFAYGYELVSAVTGEPFFATIEDPRTVDYVYFSFTTLTTVGYGDLTARTELGRMLAVSEALLGQLYLVTVVALIVANLGRERRR